jgi:acetolactate synthase-1/2/3 large subunit
MALVNGGELVVRTLLQAGVETIFGLHGAHIDTIFQSCLDHEIPIIDTRHEAAAGHAAEGYARASGRLGVALVTAGGGFTNVMTPITNAFVDRTPVLFLTGSGSLGDDETNTLQAGIDQVAMAKPVTKWAHRVVSTDHIPRLVHQAIRIAMTAPRGPVLLDIPWDILRRQVEEEEVSCLPAVLPSGGSVPSSPDLQVALDVLREAERPVIIVGSEARSSSSAADLAELCRITGIPVFADSEGLSVLHEVPRDAYGGLVQGLYGFSQAGAAPDAVLMLGIRFGLSTVHGTGYLIPKAARIVQVDGDGRELGRLQAISHGIVSNPAATLTALKDAAANFGWPERDAWRTEVRELVARRRRLVGEKADGDKPLHPFRASEILATHLTAETTVVADGALTYLWLGEVMSQVRPSKYLCHGYLGSMGVGFGTALGAQVADLAANRRTILVTGDGAVGFSLAEFDTLVRKQIPLIVVVMNNQSWGATLHFQQLAVGANRVTNTRLENGAYHEVARAFGADGYYVEDADQFERALTAALATDRPACINVMVRLDVIPPEELILIGMDPFAQLPGAD